MIKNAEILTAFKKVKRENFLPSYLKDLAYSDMPLPISETEVMNQVSTTLFFLDVLNPKSGDIIYEVGAGTGYSTALLSEIVGKSGKVVSFELDKELYKKAKENLKRYRNIELILGNGLRGWNTHAPYDGIILFGAFDETPLNLINQLKVKSAIVFPKGKMLQTLIKITRMEKGIKTEEFGEYRLSRLIKQFLK